MIDPQDKATVVSLFPLPITETKPGIYPGRFHIPASQKEPSLLVVGQSVHYVYVGDDRPQLEIAIPAADMAKSIVDDFVNAQIAVTEYARPGVGWLRGEVTLSELKTKHVSFLSNLRQLHKAWYLELVKMADDDWQRYRKHVVISDLQRLAARDLGYTDREWTIDPEKLASFSCPACGTSVIPGVAVCPSCRCIIDQEKYKKLTFAA